MYAITAVIKYKHDNIKNRLLGHRNGVIVAYIHDYIKYWEGGTLVYINDKTKLYWDGGTVGHFHTSIIQ